MALVGNISGSINHNSLIGVSGSVIVANRPDSLFPSLPGIDTTFFVSGSTDGTGRSVFGGDVISSGSFNLKTGTGGVSQFSATSTGLFVNNSAGTIKTQIAASTGDITTSGNVAVNGGAITTTAATATLFNANATTVTIGTGASTVNVGGQGTRVVVPGDFEVQGTTITADVTTITVKDPIIGLGFTSASMPTMPGDRGWVGSMSGDMAGNVAMIWDNDYTEFAVGRTSANASSTQVAMSGYGPFHAGDIQGRIVTASLGFSGSHTTLIDGTSAFIAGSGVTISSASNGAVTISASGTGAPANAQYLVLSNDATLTSERAFVASTGLKSVDGGSNGNYTLSIDDNIVATLSGSAFRGTVKPDTGYNIDLGSTGSPWYRFYANQISGSLTTLLDGTSYLVAGTNISITSASNGSVRISTTGVGDVTGPGSSTQYAVALFNDTTGKVLRNSALTTNGSNSLWVNGDLNVSGSVYFGDMSTDTVSFTARVNTDILPSSDMLYNLGSEEKRWANVYTGDLHLRNDRGDYTLIEEEDFLTIRFNKTGKRYKFVLEAVPEFDESPVLKF